MNKQIRSLLLLTLIVNQCVVQASLVTNVQEGDTSAIASNIESAASGYDQEDVEDVINDPTFDDAVPFRQYYVKKGAKHTLTFTQGSQEKKVKYTWEVKEIVHTPNGLPHPRVFQALDLSVEVSTNMNLCYESLNILDQSNTFLLAENLIHEEIDPMQTIVMGINMGRDVGGQAVSQANKEIENAYTDFLNSWESSNIINSAQDEMDTMFDSWTSSVKATPKEYLDNRKDYRAEVQSMMLDYKDEMEAADSSPLASFDEYKVDKDIQDVDTSGFMEDLENGVHSMASGMTDSPMKKTLYDMRFTKDDKQSVKDEMNSIGDDLQSAKDEIAEGINNDYSSIKSTIQNADDKQFKDEVGQWFDEVAPSTASDTLDNLASGKSMVHDNLDEINTATTSVLNDVEPQFILDEMIVEGGATWMYWFLKDIYQSTDMDAKTYQALYNAASKAINDKNSINTLTIDTSVLSSGYTYAIEAYGYDEEDDKVAVQWFFFTVVADDQPYQKLFDINQEKYIKLDRQCIFGEDNTLNLDWSKLNLASGANSITITTGHISNIENGDSCLESFGGSNTVKLGVDKTETQVTIEADQVAEFDYYFIKFAVNYDDYDLIDYKLITVFNSEYFQGNQDYEDSDNETEDIDSDNEDSDNEEFDTEEGTEGLVADDGSANRNLAQKPNLADIQQDLQTQQTSQNDSVDEPSVSPMDLEDMMKESRGPTVLSKVVDDAAYKLHAQSCTSNPPQLNPFRIYTEYNKFVMYGSIRAPKAIDFKFRACGFDYGCTGNGKCTTNSNSKGDTYYQCACNSGWFGTYCSLTEKDQKAQNDSQEKIIGNLAAFMGIDVKSGKLPDDSEIQEIDDKDTVSALVHQLASTTNLTPEQQTQVVGLLYALLSGPNKFENEQQLDNVNKAQNQLSLNILRNNALTKQEKWNQMKESNVEEVRQKMVGRSCLFLKDQGKDTQDLGNENKAAKVVTVNSATTITFGATIVDPATGDTLAAPTVELPKVEGATYGHVEAVPCSDSFVDCHPQSQQLTITMLDKEGKPLAVDKTSISFTVPFSKTIPSGKKIKCVFQDEKTGLLSDVNVSTTVPDGQVGEVKCKSTHLTTFTVTSEDTLNEQQNTNEKEVESSAWMIPFMVIFIAMTL